MTTTRRRIVRRAVMALAVVVLLPVWYVGSWLAISRAQRDRLIHPRTAQKISPAFRPIVDYCDTELPGSNTLRRLWWYLNPYTNGKEPSLFGGKFTGVTHTQGPLRPRWPSEGPPRQ